MNLAGPFSKVFLTVLKPARVEILVLTDLPSFGSPQALKNWTIEGSFRPG